MGAWLQRIRWLRAGNAPTERGIWQGNKSPQRSTSNVSEWELYNKRREGELRYAVCALVSDHSSSSFALRLALSIFRYCFDFVFCFLFSFIFIQWLTHLNSPVSNFMWSYICLCFSSSSSLFCWFRWFV